VAPAPPNRPPGWVWLLAIPAGPLVLAVLAAIAIPTLLGARERAEPAVLDRAGVQFRCTEAPSNPRGIHAVCVWDDGDTAGMGVGYGQLPAEDLADFLADAHGQLHG
jgi:hypothetical protein